MALGSKFYPVGLYYGTMNYQAIKFALQKKRDDMPMKNGEIGMKSGI
jgi:hypothetical protein